LSALRTTFCVDVCETVEGLIGENPSCHPAHFLALANDILAANAVLGPWIHTGSTVEHYTQPKDGERLSLRGYIGENFSVGGHDFIVLYLGLFGDEDRPLVAIEHSAIIRPNMTG